MKIKIIKLVNNLRDYYTIKKSGLFDPVFYLQNNPDVRQADIDPLWHYVRSGWKEERNPSKAFNTRVYLQENQDVKKIGINPLCHYIKNGIKVPQKSKGIIPCNNNNFVSYSMKIDKENQHDNKKVESALKNTQEDILISPFSYSDSKIIAPRYQGNGKHIEFIGINGSGKTTLFKEVNKELSKILGFTPGPDQLWMGIINDSRVLEQPGGQLSCLTNFFIEQTDFIRNILEADRIYCYTEKIPSIRNISITYFLALCTFYQAVKQTDSNAWFLIDEGFCVGSFKYVIDEYGKIVSSFSEKIIDTMPKVDLLIHMDTSENLCLQRMKRRETGIPGPYRHLSDIDYLNYLTLRKRLIENFVNFLKDHSVNVVTITEDLTVNQSLNKVMEALLTK
ncbi:MAG TPA: deoxynucleoside kinase [Brevefilum fermentans]|jgi:thymidylate kinase|nr:deoxynucleoside kinase [Brevefilum fermentans]